MPLLSFTAEFADLVEKGEKRQTIRPYRQDDRDPRVGQTLYFYTGGYDHTRRKIGEAVCTFVGHFTVDGQRSKVVPGAWARSTATLNGYDLDYSDFASLEELAHRDGFEAEVPFLEWIDKAYGLPFEGLLIRWGSSRP